MRHCCERKQTKNDKGSILIKSTTFHAATHQRSAGDWAYLWRNKSEQGRLVGAALQCKVFVHDQRVQRHHVQLPDSARCQQGQHLAQPHHVARRCAKEQGGEALLLASRKGRVVVGGGPAKEALASTCSQRAYLKGEEENPTSFS